MEAPFGSLTNVCGYSQNQSQGIELDVQKDEGCVETKVKGAAEMAAGGWLCVKEKKSWYGSHGR